MIPQLFHVLRTLIRKKYYRQHIHRFEFMKNLRFIAINLVVILGLLSAVELSIAILLNHPSAIPAGWVVGLRDYYMQKDRKIVQFDAQLAEYDPLLFYRLRPGSHRFANREFDTEMSINSHGFRAEENDMIGPRIIFLGDSYTMGWGTESDECFPSLVAAELGLRCLNTGISSYGTVREFELFKELDTSQLQFLIIQYDFNDLGENTDHYFDSTYSPASKIEYEKHVQNQLEATRYFPFKHVGHFTRKWFDERFPRAEEPAEETDEEQPYVDQWVAFMNVVRRAAIPNHVEIIVIQVGSEHQQDVLINPLKENLSKGDSAIDQRIHVLDLQKLLKEEHYYLLDQHLKPSGHAIVAQALAEELSGLRESKK